jgi:hypothetical protein
MSFLAFKIKYIHDIQNKEMGKNFGIKLTKKGFEEYELKKGDEVK